MVETIVTVSRLRRLPQPVPPGMPVVGALVAAYCSLLQLLGKSSPPSRRARLIRQRHPERADGAIVPATGLRGIP